uniref:5'-3' DNA helicase ZGRF1 n=1 Tax=Sarcophilus harrisii TaxID=9305 RepID=G3VY94_SARHA
MTNQEFIVLYTHQKMKKSKVWQDGILKISFSRNKATLYDDKGQCLESLFLKQCEMKPGDDLETDRYLITIEDVKNVENIPSNLEAKMEIPMLKVQRLKPSNKPKPCLRTGLKRKFIGFQGPRQIPKKMATRENDESAASLLFKESYSTSSSLFSCTPPLFSTIGKNNKDTVMPSDCNSIIDYKNGNTTDESISLLLSSITSSKKGFYEDDCFFLNSVRRKSDSSLDNEYMKEDSLTTKDSDISQNTRSKEKILALLKSKSSPTLEVIECFPPGKLTEEIKDSLKSQSKTGREEKTEKNTTIIPHQLHLENDVRKLSQWDIYLPNNLSINSSDVSNTKGKSEDDNLDLDLKGPFEQKMYLFATGSEKKVECITDNQIYNDDRTICNQKINFQVSSSCQSELGEGLPVVYSNNEHHYLSKSKSEMLFSNDYPKCIKESVFTRKNTQELNETSVPKRESHQNHSFQLEKQYPHLQKDSSCINNNLAISENLATFLSKSRAENENINVNTDWDSKPETFLEVTFNLNNIDISDTEEESQNSIFSLSSEHWLKKIPSEDNICAEGKFIDSNYSRKDDNEHFSHLITDSSLPAKYPSKKTLSSQICTETAIDFERIGKGNEASFLFNSNLPKIQNGKEEMTVGTSHFEILIEFQGHQVVGSASSEVMIRGPSSQMEWNQYLDSVEYKSFTQGPCFLTPKLPSSCMMTDFLQMMSPVQRRLIPDSTFPLSLRNEEIMINLPESLKARTSSGVEKFNCSEKDNVQRLQKAQVPLITLCPVKVHSQSENCSYRMDSEVQKSFGSPILGSSKESTGYPVNSFEVTPLRLSFFSLVPPQSKQSKWLKYKNMSQGDPITLNRTDVNVNENFFAASSSAMRLCDPEDNYKRAVKKSPNNSMHLEMIKSMLHQQQLDFYYQELVIRKKTLFQNLDQTSQPEEIQKILSQTAHNGFNVTESEINTSTLSFPSGTRSKYACVPKRQIHIPAHFQSPAQYKQIFTTSLIEHLNILLFEVSKRLHHALWKVNTSFYTSMKIEKEKNIENSTPICHHQEHAKLVMVKKEGPNKGRLFYTCGASKVNQCKFFKWFEEITPANLTWTESVPCTVLHDIKSIGIYLRCQNIALYEECQLLVRKLFDFQSKQCGKSKRFAHINPEFLSESKSKLYLKLSRRENSSTYGKDDLWVISKTLDFELDTFIACSVFFGPSSYNEVELLPLKGYFPSNWPSDTLVHALLVCNASTELTTLRNLQEYFNPTTVPIIQHLLTMSSYTEYSNNRINKRKFIPPAFNRITNKNCELLSSEAALQLANEIIQIYKLNMDQATALIQITLMMASHENASDPQEQHTLPITIIHGVFGAGKSYLLTVVILFLVQLFEKSPAPRDVDARPWKILISSSTNIAVDRILLGLLNLGFENFIRVGSIRKISKPILPYSLHAGLGNENEQLKELHALMKEDLTVVEKIYVRKSIEQYKLGTNRALLKKVQVVGITCAACPFPCMNNLKFPVVVLDECSQMTEPVSLLPIARFNCEKLVLVGDPKQLPPTIQGSESVHDSGLEQTLFDRLCLMGHKTILLRTQYRCHPAISAIANDLFYEGNLINGVSEIERSPLLEWLPTLCFYNVKGIEQIEKESFQNVAEAAFTFKLIQSLIVSGIEGSMIGVITLYKSQMYKLCTLFSTAHCDHPNLRAVQVSTVDAFQGAEKEIIILSCVRTKQVGFIDSEKRMNVALTRGKRHLLIVGNLDCLKKNRLWGKVIQHCEGKQENGLQHSSQCEPNLNLLLKRYLEKKNKIKKDNSNNKSF